MQGGRVRGYYELQKGPLPEHEKFGDRPRDVQAEYESDGSSPYQAPPAALREDQYVSVSDSE